MIAVDTGPIVALFDKSDNYHGLCVEALKTVKDSLITTWPVITEAMYLLDFSLRAQELCWEFIASGALEIDSHSGDDAEELKNLMRKYADLPMSLADAGLMLTTKKRKITTIFTLDKHFTIYKPAHVSAFKIIPAKRRQK